MTIVKLGAAWAARIGWLLASIVGLASLIACVWRRGADARSISAPLASLWITTQLLVGPYTTLLYLSGWIIPALALPSCVGDRGLQRRVLITVSMASLAVALVPGSAGHRAFEAAGVHTLIDMGLWLLSLMALIDAGRKNAPAIDAAPPTPL